MLLKYKVSGSGNAVVPAYPWCLVCSGKVLVPAKNRVLWKCTGLVVVARCNVKLEE